MNMSKEYTPELNLWKAVIAQKVNDAIFPFKLPEDNVSGFDDQYLKYIEAGKMPYISGGRQNEINQALWFFEYGQIDTIAQLVGYDSLFVNKTFDLVQQAVTLRKRLRVELEFPVYSKLFKYITFNNEDKSTKRFLHFNEKTQRRIIVNWFVRTYGMIP